MTRSKNINLFLMDGDTKKCGYATSPIALISTFSHTKICYCTLFQDIVFYLLEVDYNVFIYY